MNSPLSGEDVDSFLTLAGQAADAYVHGDTEYYVQQVTTPSGSP